MDVISSLLNFGVLVSILVLFGRKPFMAFLGARRANIQREIEEAKQQSQEATAELEEWEKKVSNKERLLKDQLNEAKALIERTRTTIMATAKTQGDRILEEAKLVVQSERSKAGVRLRNEVVAKSTALAREFLKSHLAEKDQKRIIGEYVESVGHGTI